MSSRYQLIMMSLFVVTFSLVIMFLHAQGMRPYPGGCSLPGHAEEVLCP